MSKENKNYKSIGINAIVIILALLTFSYFNKTRSFDWIFYCSFSFTIGFSALVIYIKLTKENKSDGSDKG